ncbi:MAG: hypothetical protein A4E49_03414 [Methanosaeta sp. PtaU1.Bin112]|nr:MAG: hypothetical protein A4E49_03414 [Methanosaeta sp. PtaU1.Bin112]
MLNFSEFMLMLAAIACIIFAACASPTPIVIEPEGMDLSLEGMKISDPEHTAEYLAKTGGTARPGLQTYGRNLAGNWSLELRDMKSIPIGDVDLQLHQSEAALFGTGTFKQGLIRQMAAAEGSLLEGNAMILNVVTLDSAYLYRMTLNSADGNSTSGTFTLYLPKGEAPVKGTVSGGRNDWRRIS